MSQPRSLAIFTAFFLSLSFSLSASAQDDGARPPENEAPAFQVKDIPKEPPIEGQLGGPGAPSLKDQQEHLARSMLDKGICNESYFGAEFCAKQKQKTFRVTDQFGRNGPGSSQKSQE